MAQDHWSNEAISLFTVEGERKYLTLNERRRFLAALPVLKSESDRTFCEMIFYTGCRPSEALSLTAMQIDIDESMVIIRSLKKRGKKKNSTFRPVPVPREFMARLDEVHNLRALKAGTDRGANTRIWAFSRTTGWDRVHSVMDAAGLDGIKACGRGLRHAYGVGAAIAEVPTDKIQGWLGHEDAAATAVYTQMASQESHAIASRMWQEVLG